MWEYQKLLPNHNNWWNDVQKLLLKYDIKLTEDDIKDISKETFKQKIKKAVVQVAFKELQRECLGKEKTNSQGKPQKNV